MKEIRVARWTYDLANGVASDGQLEVVIRDLHSGSYDLKFSQHLGPEDSRLIGNEVLDGWEIVLRAQK